MIKDISYPDAALGAKIEVPIIDGSYEHLKIPEGIQNKEILRIKGKGMPGLNDRGKGNLYVEVNIKTPTKLNRKAKKLLEELDDELKK
jgi:molecular chaperone DnaJ